MASVSDRRFLLLYGSQTGQAQAIAEEICQQAKTRGYCPDIHCLSMSEKEFVLPEEPLVVIVVSTTGDGEPPDTVNKFWRKLKRKTVPVDLLKGVHYALLGLGDTNYTNFCNMGMMLNKRLLELSASSFYETGYADDGVGLELVVDPWIEGLWGALDKYFHSKTKKPLLELTSNNRTEEHIQPSDSTAQSTSDSTAQSTSDSTAQSTNDSTAQSTSDSTAQSTTDSIAQSTSNSTAQSTSDSTAQSTSDSTAQSTSDSSAQSTSDSTAQSTTDSTTQSTSDSTAQSTSDSTAQSTSVSTAQSTSDSTAQSTSDFTAQSTSDSTTQSTSVSTAQSTSDSTAQSTSDSTAQSTTDSTAQSTSDSTVKELSHSLAKQLHIGATDPAEMQLLKGSTDDSWLYQPIYAPSLPSPFLIVDLQQKSESNDNEFSYSESVQGCTMTKSTVSMATISNRKVLTSVDAQKVVLELEIIWKCSDLNYQPGDALCFMCPNDPIEVNYVIERLELQSVRDHLISLSINPSSDKKNPVIPKHIPKVCTVQQYFTHCADMRAIPKKALLAVLSEYCTSDFERARLKWLASRQGSSDYMRLIVEHHVDLLDLLYCFTTCSPPLERLIELLPRLQPRYYSVASSPLLRGQNTTRIVFNITELPPRCFWPDKNRQGVCTGWLNSLSLEDKHNAATCSTVIPIYPRLKNPFHLPPDPLVPIILIGPGTGIAPLIGFLEHRKALKTVSGVDVGPSWLFFGCRHYDHDFLYKSEIDDFIAVGILTLFNVSFSRLSEDMYSNDGHVKYVQDLMRRNWKSLGEWIMEKGAVVFVCGDAQKMIVSIKETMIEVLQQYTTDKDIDGDGQGVMKDLVDDGRYIVDLWI